MPSERFMRQVKATNIAAKVILLLLAALSLQRICVAARLAGKAALPKLKSETQQAFERYVNLVEARSYCGWMGSLRNNAKRTTRP
jgi:hypothetical protein